MENNRRKIPKNFNSPGIHVTCVRRTWKPSSACKATAGRSTKPTLRSSARVAPLWLLARRFICTRSSTSRTRFTREYLPGTHRQPFGIHQWTSTSWASKFSICEQSERFNLICVDFISHSATAKTFPCSRKTNGNCFPPLALIPKRENFNLHFYWNSFGLWKCFWAQRKFSQLNLRRWRKTKCLAWWNSLSTRRSFIDEARRTLLTNFSLHQLQALQENVFASAIAAQPREESSPGIRQISFHVRAVPEAIREWEEAEGSRASALTGREEDEASLSVLW